MNTDNITLNALFIEYFDIYGSNLAPHTYLSDLSTYKKHIRGGIGKMPVKDISFIVLQRFTTSLIANGYAPKTAKNIMSKVSVVLRLAQRLGYISSNHAELVEFPRIDNKVYFNHDQQTQTNIINAIINDTSPHADFFFFLLHGRRKGEALKLRWCDIDFSNDTYTIIAENNKVRRTMIYTLTPQLKSRFKSRYDSVKRTNPNEYVFINPVTKKPYKDLRRAWIKLLSDNNLPKMRLHDIRHLIGTYSINVLKLPIESVAATLGHTNTQTTKRYITAQKELSGEVMTALLGSVDKLL